MTPTTVQQPPGARRPEAKAWLPKGIAAAEQAKVEAAIAQYDRLVAGDYKLYVTGANEPCAAGYHDKDGVYQHFTGTPDEVQRWMLANAWDAAPQPVSYAQMEAAYAEAAVGAFSPTMGITPEGDVVVAEPEVELPDDDVAPEPPLVDLPDILLGPYSFLCGSAGTGKTYLARAMARQLSGTILAATTGIASVNLGEGTTINALLKYFDTASLRDNHVSGQLQAQLGRLWRAGIRRILLDEVSMMDGEQLTILTEALEELSGRGYVMDSQLQDEMDEADAWAGVQTSDAERRAPIALTLIGDFAQLPPVKAPFAFQSPAWGKFEPTTHRLTRIWRQSDVDFITAIQAARRGDPGPVIDYFGPRLHQTSDSEFPGPTILATNDAVARFNGLRLAKLSTPQHLFVTERWGVQRGDWKQIPDALGLKVGALVMLLSNRREMGVDGMPGPLVYANGDLATVDSLDADRKQCVVTLQRNGQQQIVDWVTRANTIPLEPGRRKALKAEGKENLISKDGRMETVGEVTYLPVRVAYATTVHKSQGLSLDKVQINTREGFFKTAGMLYVSLSRARTVEGLRLVGSVDGLRERCTVDTRVVPWL